MKKVALIGNPNCGKSSLFNALTGGKQHIGNWPGVTVEKKTGEMKCGEIPVQIVDLPGIYSLSAYSIDERIARDFIIKDNPDLVVVIVDTTNFERNLYLLTEIMAITNKVVLVLNMWDLAVKSGMKVSLDELKDILKIPVVKTIGNKGEGVDDLKKVICEAINGKIEYAPEHRVIGEKIEKNMKELAEFLSHFNPDLPSMYLAVKLVEKDPEVVSYVKKSKDADVIFNYVNKVIKDIEQKYNDDSVSVIISQRYAFVHGVYKEVVEKERTIESKISLSDKIDRILTNRYLGIPLFLLLLYITFKLVFAIGNPIADWLDSAMGYLASQNEILLSHIGAGKTLISFLNDGVIGGVGSVLVFLPNIMILYFLLGILEDSGYMARAAFVVDKVMHKVGLHGKSAIPLVISFGCNIPGILATRTMKSEKDRILTILVDPFIPCSARLPIFILFASVFFKGHEGLFILSMYVLGILVAFFSALLLKKLFFKGVSAPLIMELPPYHLPDFKVVWRTMIQRTGMFVKKAGTFIFLTIVFVWLLASMPLGVEYASPGSLIGHLGRIFAPLFKPLGFGFWQSTVSLIFGFLAKEAVVGTLGTVLGAAEEGLKVILPHYFNTASAISFSVYSLLYVPCVASVAVIWKETNYKWMLVSVIYGMSVAYIIAFIAYHIALIF